MKDNKGFTLVELTIILVMVASLTVLTYLSVTSLIERQKKKAFIESLNGIIAATDIYASNNRYSFSYVEDKVWYENNGWYIDLTAGIIEMNKDDQIVSGHVFIDDKNTVHIVNVYNGSYCGVSGTTADFEIKEGSC